MVYFIIYYVVFNIANHLNIIMRYILRFINIVNVACELSSLICKGSVKMWCGSNAKKYTRNNIIANGHQYRSSRPEMFCEKVFLKTSQNPQENACARAFLNTVAGLRPATLETLAQVFFCEFCENSKNTFSHTTRPLAASASISIIISCRVFYCLVIIWNIFTRSILIEATRNVV